ncbi:TlpA family protein disulfide reductase [Flavobacterium haoranii]|uniref:Thioredoxin n=1 Tax=Flavobacterium haoranii TaxID=683124 RepID=A0A1M6DJB7_9FLAO|nr:thioredoxin domain-containing protein [Flavobacterium haoranii]SHI73305.1 Thioredoxin [Flavobacterium haoranii]
MVKLLSIIFLLIWLNCFSQTDKIEKVSIESVHYMNEERFFAEDKKSLGNVKLYKIDNISLLEMINKSEKKLKIVLFYGFWCPPCKEMLPKLIELSKKNEDNIDLFLITAEQDQRFDKVFSYLKQLNLDNPSFIIDTKKYGNEKKPFIRTEKLIQEICKECDYEKMGFPSFIIYNQQNEMVFDATYENTNEYNYNQIEFNLRK